MEPGLERFLEYEGSTREYFLNFIPNSKDQCNLNAKRTDTYKEIVHFLKPANEIKTMCCAKFAFFLAKINKPFLTQLQL